MQKPVHFLGLIEKFQLISAIAENTFNLESK